jgi:hypothetical protein
MDDKVYEEKAIEKLLPVAIISEIPSISIVADLQAERKQMWVGWATAAVISIMILLGSAVSYLRG